MMKLLEHYRRRRTTVKLLLAPFLYPLLPVNYHTHTCVYTHIQTYTYIRCFIQISKKFLENKNKMHVARKQECNNNNNNDNNKKNMKNLFENIRDMLQCERLITKWNVSIFRPHSTLTNLPQPLEKSMFFSFYLFFSSFEMEFLCPTLLPSSLLHLLRLLPNLRLALYNL